MHAVVVGHREGVLQAQDVPFRLDEKGELRAGTHNAATEEIADELLGITSRTTHGQLLIHNNTKPSELADLSVADADATATKDEGLASTCSVSAEGQHAGHFQRCSHCRVDSDGGHAGSTFTEEVLGLGDSVGAQEVDVARVGSDRDVQGVGRSQRTTRADETSQLRKQLGGHLAVHIRGQLAADIGEGVLTGLNLAEVICSEGRTPRGDGCKLASCGGLLGGVETSAVGAPVIAALNLLFHIVQRSKEGQLNPDAGDVVQPGVQLHDPGTHKGAPLEDFFGQIPRKRGRSGQAGN